MKEQDITDELISREETSGYSFDEENSIEEDIEELKRLLYRNELTQYGKRKLINYYEQQEKNYKRLLKENEELLEVKVSASAHNRILELEKENEELKKYKEYYSSARQLVDNNYIHKQKIKDIIDRIDYDIKKTKEIISNDRRNCYQIVRLRAMNTKSLDIKKRLQELLENR